MFYNSVVDLPIFESFNADKDRKELLEELGIVCSYILDQENSEFNPSTNSIVDSSRINISMMRNDQFPKKKVCKC